MISKPIVPPWHDSGKNLVRDLASAGERYQYHVMAVKGAVPPGPNCVVEPVYSSAGIYAAGIKQNSKVLMRLLRPDRLPVYHFFFAPNRLTSTAARYILALKKRRRTVHTICSVPASFEGIDDLLFAERIVVLSRHTKSLFEAHTRRPVLHIPPCVPVREPVDDQRKLRVLETLGLPAGPTVLFAGDYEFSEAAAVCLRALPEILGSTDARFVFACRIKREPSREIEARIKAEVQAMGLGDRVSFCNEVDDMEALAASATVHVLPADSLYAKMDIPLVLLESLREGVPVVVSDHGPLAELAAGGGGVATPTGDHRACAAAVVDLLGNAEKREEMASQGQRLVQSTYSPAAVSARYEELYDELLSSQ